MLASYPGEEVRESVLSLVHEPSVSAACRELPHPELWERVKKQARKQLATPDEAKDLASRYIGLFDRGSSENSLYETGYGIRRSQMKTGELADIAGFYRAFGFGITGDEAEIEMLDHIAVEAEFYALLLAKEAHLLERGENEGAQIVLEGRRKFLQDHLGRYPAFLAERPGIKSDPFYSAVFAWCAELIAQECRDLDIGIVPVDYAFGGDQEEEISCAVAEEPLTQLKRRNRMSS